MTFFVHEQGDDIFINIEYYTAIFKPETIQRMASHLKNIIKAVIQDPAIQLKDIEIISDEEKQQVLYEFNDTGREYPRDKTIHQLFAEQVEKAPDPIALVGANRHHDSVCPHRYEITYRQLDEQSNRVANYLYYGNHVTPDQPVGIMMDRSLEMIIAGTWHSKSRWRLCTHFAVVSPGTNQKNDKRRRYKDSSFPKAVY